MMGNIRLNQGMTREAETHAEILMTCHPDNPIGYALKGQVLFYGGLYEDAIDWFNKALKKTAGRPETSTFRNLYQAYSKTGEFRKAYRVLLDNTNVFDEETSYKELYQLAVYAAYIGKKKHAQTLLKMARSRVPDSDTEYMRKIRDADFYK